MTRSNHANGKRLWSCLDPAEWRTLDQIAEEHATRTHDGRPHKAWVRRVLEDWERLKTVQQGWDEDGQPVWRQAPAEAVARLRARQAVRDWEHSPPKTAKTKAKAQALLDSLPARPSDGNPRQSA